MQCYIEYEYMYNVCVVVVCVVCVVYALTN